MVWAIWTRRRRRCWRSIPATRCCCIRFRPAGARILPELSRVPANYLAALNALPPGPGPHFITGPVYVRGAKPGDTLQIDILDAKVWMDWGFVAILPLLGTLPDEFTEYETIHPTVDHARGVAILPWGTELALEPFFGIIGVAPPKAWGRCGSPVPRAFGGNMDNKELKPGTTLYLPVFNEGALFMAGDGHGMQGDGEVCITALEIGLSGTFRLTVRKDLKLEFSVRGERDAPDVHWPGRGPGRRGEASGAGDGEACLRADQPVAQPGLHAVLAGGQSAGHAIGGRQQGCAHDAGQGASLIACPGVRTEIASSL